MRRNRPSQSREHPLAAHVRTGGPSRALIAAGLALLAVGGGVRPARAHDVSYAYAEIHWRGARADVSLTVHADDAAMVLGVPLPAWFRDSAFVARAGRALADSVSRRLVLRAGGRDLPLRYLGARPDPLGRGVTLELAGQPGERAGELVIRGPVFPFVATHQTFVNVYAGDVLVLQDVLTAEHRETRAFASGRTGQWAVLRTYGLAGIRHIAIGPDHILFVAGLLLLGGSLARLLKVVTAFTAAHSVTLALAALGLVRPSARFVEPLIALSVVLVAFETLRARERGHDHRAALAFGFGLVHGFGFASVLAEFGLPRGALGVSLAGFNLGVELGQAVLVLAIAPPLAWLARSSERAHRHTVTVAAIAIAAAGGFWFVQRLLAR